MDELVQVMVDDRGDLIIPPELQQRLRLSPGMVLVVEPGDEQGVHLRVQRDAPMLIDKQGVLVFRGTPLDDLSGSVQCAREERTHYLLQRDST